MKRSSLLQSLLLGLLTCVSSLAVPHLALAQYMGNNFHGDFGVNSGTQAGPGWYVAIPFAQLNADHIKDADGNTLAASSSMFSIYGSFFRRSLSSLLKKLFVVN